MGRQFRAGKGAGFSGVALTPRQQRFMGNPYDPVSQPTAYTNWQRTAADISPEYANERYAPSAPAPAGQVKTAMGYMDEDRELPKEPKALKQYVEDNPFSAYSYQLTTEDFGPPLMSVPESSQERGDFSDFRVNRENVQTQAKMFVKESQDIQYSRRYVVKTVQEAAKENGVEVSDAEAEDFYNQEYARRARAILTAAEAGKVKLSEAQERRLQVAADGRYLEVVYTTESSENGSLDNRTVRKRGRASERDRAILRREWYDRLYDDNQRRYR